MDKKKKDTLIEFMVKHNGYTIDQALKHFECKEEIIKTRVKKPTNLRKIAEDKRMSPNQIRTMIIYLHKSGYSKKWIVETIGRYSHTVAKIIEEYEKSKSRKPKNDE